MQNRLRAALSVKIFVSLQGQEEEEGGADSETGLEERLDAARALFYALVGQDSSSSSTSRGGGGVVSEGSVTSTPLPAHSVAAALRLSTVRSGTHQREEEGCGEVEQEWDDWQVAFVWHDVE